MIGGLSKSVLLGSNLVSFLPNVTPEGRADILDVLLLAELSASELYSREKKWVAWMDTYRATLLNNGLKHIGGFSPKPVKVSNEKKFRQETAKLIQGITPAQLAPVAKSAVDDMFNSDHARYFFSNWFSFNSGRSDSFQIVPCERAASGEVNIAACGLQMETRTKPKLPMLIGIPTWPISYEMTLTFRGGGLVYDGNTYAQYRERVKKELLRRAAETIQHIPI